MKATAGSGWSGILCERVSCNTPGRPNLSAAKGLALIVLVLPSDMLSAGGELLQDTGSTAAEP